MNFNHKQLRAAMLMHHAVDGFDTGDRFATYAAAISATIKLTADANDSPVDGLLLSFVSLVVLGVKGCADLKPETLAMLPTVEDACRVIERETDDQLIEAAEQIMKAGAR